MIARYGAGRIVRDSPARYGMCADAYQSDYQIHRPDRIMRTGGVRLCLSGSHRRIPRQAIESLPSKPPSEAKPRSWWLHAAVLGELVEDPEGTIAQARRNLASMRARHPDAAPYLDGWRKILDAG